jgi:hypothetical protein
MLATGCLDATAVFPYSKKSYHVFLHWTFDPKIWDHCALLELGNNQLVMQHNIPEKRELRKALITH